MIYMIRVSKYVLKYWYIALIAFLFMAIDVVLGFMIPLYVTEIIDDVLPKGESGLSELYYTALLLLLVAVGSYIGGVLNNIISQYIAQVASANLRNELFTKISKLSFRNIDKFKTSRLINTTTNDVLQVQTFYQMLLRILVRAPLLIVFGLIFAIRASSELSLLFVIAIPLLLSVIIIVFVKAFPLFSVVQKKLDGLNGVVHETVNAPRVIKSFVKDDYENNRFEHANDEYKKINQAAQSVFVFVEPAIYFVVFLTIGGILLGAYFLMPKGILVDNGVAQIGLLFSFNTYIMFVLMGLMMFTMMMVFISRASVSAKRIFEVLDEKIDLHDDLNAIESFSLTGGIVFNDVSFGYLDGGNNVISNISFTVKKGETIGIIGSTGSGKSTIVSLIPRMYDVTSGSIMVDTKEHGNVDIRKLKMSDLRNQISLITQEPIVFSGSIGTNILQGKEDSTYDEVLQASEEAVAYEYINDLTHKFNSQTLQKGTNLSGGQKQRLSIARGFVRQPAIMILDDSTSAVDAKSEVDILESIKKLSGNMTTLVIAQKISTIEHMDKILVIDDTGHVDGFATHRELLETSIVYQEIYTSQYGTGGSLNEKTKN